MVAVLLAAVCFGTTGTAQALLDVDASPTVVGLARIVLGGGLLAFCVLRGPRPTGVPGTGALARVPTGWVVAGGAAGVLAYQPTFFAGTTTNGVAIGTVVALGSAPVVTGVLDAGLRARRPERRWWTATALALVGLALVAVGSGGGSFRGGVLWSVAAGASYALYAVAVKELLDRGWASGSAVGAVFGSAAGAALPLLLLVGAGGLLTVDGLVLTLWLGVVTTTVAYLLFGYGLARLPATTVATLTLAEPLCAALLGVGVLGERLAPAAVAGVLVLGLGIAVLTTRRRRAGAVAGAAAA
ncbi:drug/metabolite transporter, DME family [Klenkia marina]|uniref:Drug/metabolite transporter, DME family n=1 Tax=Klenkia marina TaxID=1960309 RepID=A0A1G4YNS6_9ACTN|nr:drug/metabolite transporter, DME family [Klenkia marina]